MASYGSGSSSKTQSCRGTHSGCLCRTRVGKFPRQTRRDLLRLHICASSLLRMFFQRSRRGCRLLLWDAESVVVFFCFGPASPAIFEIDVSGISKCCPLQIQLSQVFALSICLSTLVSLSKVLLNNWSGLITLYQFGMPHFSNTHVCFVIVRGNNTQ